MFCRKYKRVQGMYENEDSQRREELILKLVTGGKMNRNLSCSSVVTEEILIYCPVCGSLQFSLPGEEQEQRRLLSCGIYETAKTPRTTLPETYAVA